MKPRVLLVHGLWMNAPSLFFWAKQLRVAGYRPICFSYKSLLHAPEHSMARLRAAALAEPNTHILAHSLGGLVALKAMADCTDFNGNIICVGSPLTGSQVVRRYAATPLSKLAGRNLALLGAGIDVVPDGLRVIAIAGTKAQGLGRVFHRFSEPNDGTVTVSETQVPGLAAHIQVHASHSGQLFSRKVMTQVLGILQSPQPAV